MEDIQEVIEVSTKYERAIKTYGGCGAETEYFPIMSDGSIIVKKISVGNVAIFGSNYGVIDSYGRERVPCVFDSCSPINKDYYIVGKNYTSGGMSGDDYSFPKQKYGIVNSKGEVVVPLTMQGIYCYDNYVSIEGFNDEYYIGLLDHDGRLNINEAMSHKINDSLEYIYNSITGTNKMAVLGQGFILRDGEYNSYNEFVEAYNNFVNDKAHNVDVSESSEKIR